MTTRRHFLSTAVAPAFASLYLSVSADAATQAAWPTQPLRIIIPFPAGGTSDVIARLISKPLSDALGVPVVIENRTGAAGNVGAGAVAAATDNHTVLLSDVGSVAVSPLINKDLPFKPSDLQGVTMLAYSPHLLAVHPSVQASNLKELVALSQRTPINVASAGSGTPNHLGVVDIALITGMKWQHVPYRGGAQALNDTVAGTTQMLLNGMVATQPQVTAGRLKVIGVSKRSRMALIGNVPTLAEQGATGFESGTYQGVLAASTMPKAAVDRLSAVLVQVVRAPEIRARLVELGAEVMTSSPLETSAFIATDRQRWARVIERAGKQIEGTQ
jgi:tripartite-type tricarboxylate transporter receptor subunit TctC